MGWGAGRDAGSQINNSFIKVTLCILAVGSPRVNPRGWCEVALNRPGGADAGAGWRGVARGTTPRSTLGTGGGDRSADLVKRPFVATPQNRLWVAELAYRKTHSGWLYLALIVDAH